MTDSDKQLIMNLDHVETMKVLSVFKKLADEIVELKEKNAELSESNDELESEVLDSRESYNLQQMSGNFWYKGVEFTDPETDETLSHSDYFDLLKECYDKNIKLKELNAKLDLEEQECASRMDCHVATKLEERVTDLLRANFQLQDISRTYKKELDLEHMRYMEKAEEVAELKEKTKCDEDGYACSSWFREKLDFYINYQFTNEGGEYNYFLKDTPKIPNNLDDLFEYLTELKQEVKHEVEQRYLLTQEGKRLEREDDQMEDTLASLNFYKTELAEVKEENKKKAEEVAYLKERLQTRMNPVTNNDSRCGVVSVRCNYSYLAEFMECADIDIHKSRDVDEQQAYDGVIEKMSLEVEHVLDTYLQDGGNQRGAENVNQRIYERLKDIIDEAVNDDIISVKDDSSDED